MNRMKSVITVGSIALMSAVFLPQAAADAWDRKTKVTFTKPVETPGVHLAGWSVLPAGTYVFRSMESQANRHIIQILSEDEKTVYTTILAIPNYRLQATDKTVITFSERPAGEPEALRAWFYPGRNWGEEFVYPKAKAIELAKTTQVPVLFTEAEIPAEVTAPIESAEAPLVLQMRRAPVQAVRPTGEEVQLAEVVSPPPAQPEAAASRTTERTMARGADRGRTLPETASPLPLIGLLGLLALGGSYVVHQGVKRLR
jgi:hypothetical protein